MSAPEPTPTHRPTTAVSPAVSGAVSTPNVTPLRAGARAGALEPVPEPTSNRTAVSAVQAAAKRAPQIWTDPRPALVDVWEHARHGQYTGRRGVLRVAGQVYAFVAVCLTGAGYLALWVIQRPARLAVTTVLLFLASLIV